MSAPEISLVLGDCLAIMETLDPDSVDAVITDSPYGIGFMGRKWDTFTPSAAHAKRKASKHERSAARRSTSDNPNLRGRVRAPAVSPSGIEYDLSPRGLAGFQRFTAEWARHAFRVLKPGGYLLNFGMPRTYHRMACGLEDAGFEIREAIDWIFGQGFPKSVDGEREVARFLCLEAGRHFLRQMPEREADRKPGDHVCEATEISRSFLGVGSALKPAHETIAVARKPLQGRTIGESLFRFGTGGLYIDGTRIGHGVETWPTSRAKPIDGQDLHHDYTGSGTRTVATGAAPAGRWPPNLLLSHAEGCKSLGRMKVRNTGGPITGREPSAVQSGTVYEGTRPRTEHMRHGSGEGLEAMEAWSCVAECPVAMLNAQTGEDGDNGTVGRYFPTFKYEPKAFRTEREIGCEQLETRGRDESRKAGKPGGDNPRNRGVAAVGNFHPTVKPLDLMRWLVRLVTRPGQLVLEPFCGSGTTAMACKIEGVDCLAIEREDAYLAIAHARVAAAERPPILAMLDTDEPPAPSQSSMFDEGGDVTLEGLPTSGPVS